MASYTSDWGDLLNHRHRGANGTSWWWCLRGELTELSVLFLQLETYRAGVFVPARKFFITTQTQIVVKLFQYTNNCFLSGIVEIIKTPIKTALAQPLPKRLPGVGWLICCSHAAVVVNGTTMVMWCVGWLTRLLTIQIYYSNLDKAMVA